MLRAAGLALGAFIGAWDVARLLSAGERELTAIDLVTCPMIPVMRVLTAYASLSDNVLAWSLMAGNAVIYAGFGYLAVRFLEWRLSGQHSGVPGLS